MTCTWKSNDDYRATKTFSGLKTCSIQVTPCKAIGSDSTGWQDINSYWSFKLDISWRLTGSRVDCRVQSGDYLDVKLPVDFNASSITPSSSAVYEVINVNVASGGALYFRTQRGALVSRLAARSLQLAAGAVVIIDLSDYVPVNGWDIYF